MAHLGPICRALLRRKFSVFILILQIAITVTLFSNIGYAIYKVRELITRPSGIDEEQLFMMLLQRPPVMPHANYSDVQRDLTGIKNVPGVAMAAVINDTPIGWRKITVSFKVNDTHDAIATVAQRSDVSPDTIMTLGLHLVAGRHFSEKDMIFTPDTQPGVIIITKFLAENLFGKNTHVIGKFIYENGIAHEIVGVTENWIGFAPQPDKPEPTAFYPAYKNLTKKNSYLIRATSADERDAVIEKASHYIRQHYSDDVFLSIEKIDDIKAQQVRDKGILTLLTTSLVALIIIMALAIGGQTLLWSKRRTKQFGIRRALGANQSDIIGYIMIENVIICGLGLIIGAICALYLNQTIILIMGIMAPMSPLFLLCICIILLCICLISAAIPALHTIKNSPNLAIKNYKHTDH